MALKELPVLRERGTCCALPPVDAGWAESTAGLLKTLADPTRVTIVAALARSAGPVCICDFTAALGLSQPTISHHMAKLRDAGIVESEKHGIWTYHRLRDDLPAATRALLQPLLVS